MDEVGDLLVRVYDEAGQEVQITGILVNGETLVGSGGGSVESNDDTTVTATGAGATVSPLPGQPAMSTTGSGVTPPRNPLEPFRINPALGSVEIHCELMIVAVA